MARVRSGLRTGKLLAFVLPAMTFYVIFVLVPAAGGVWYSFTNWNMLNPTFRFVGFENYVEALTDPVGPASGTQRILRGGSWGTGPYCSPGLREYAAPFSPYSNQRGFRVVSR